MISYATEEEQPNALSLTKPHGEVNLKLHFDSGPELSSLLAIWTPEGVLNICIPHSHPQEENDARICDDGKQDAELGVPQDQSDTLFSPISLLFLLGSYLYPSVFSFLKWEPSPCIRNIGEGNVSDLPGVDQSKYSG